MADVLPLDGAGGRGPRQHSRRVHAPQEETHALPVEPVRNSTSTHVGEVFRGDSYHLFKKFPFISVVPYFIILHLGISLTP